MSNQGSDTVSSQPPAAPPTWAEGIAELQMAIPREEMEQRRDRILERMVRDGIDAVVFTTPQNLVYLTANQAGGRAAGNRLAMSATGEHRYILREIDRGWEGVWKTQNWVDNWVAYPDREKTNEVIARELKEIAPGGIRRLGLEIDRKSITYEDIQTLVRLTGAEEVVSCSYLVEDMRVVKSESELALMRNAGQISCEASDAILDALRNGGSDVEAALAAQSVIYARGGQHPAQDPYVFSGRGGETGHAPWFRVRPTEGELTTWFVSGTDHHYACPIERTVIKGRDLYGAQPAIDAVVAAVEAVRANIRPGMTSHDAYMYAYRTYDERGYAKYFMNHAAYSLGIYWPEFELFRLRGNDQRIVKEGMTFHLVPLLVIPDLGTFCSSRSIVVRDDGGELLNEYPAKVGPV